MVPIYGAGTVLEMGDLRCVIAGAVRLIGISRYSFPNIKTKKLARTVRVDMRHCTFPTTPRML
jgi:hypothetical protein